MVVKWAASRRERGLLQSEGQAHRAPRDSLQLALDGAGAAEQPSVHRVEAIVGGVEHEAAGHADGDADRAAVELDCKTLGNHLNSAPDGPAEHARMRPPAGRSVDWVRDCTRFDARAAHWERTLNAAARPRRAQGARVVPCCSRGGAAAVRTVNARSYNQYGPRPTIIKRGPGAANRS